jgi:hypothetical protein
MEPVLLRTMLPPSGGLDESQIRGTNNAAVADTDFRSLEATGRHATDVEGAHRKLGAGLADGLSRDDADGIADLGDLVGRRD